jgi:hypothetical protein
MRDIQHADVVLAIFAQDGVDIEVGRVPEGFPDSLVPASPVTVIGGANQARTLTAVLAFPLTDGAADGANDGDALQRYVEFVRPMGWTETDMKMGGPFGPTRMIMLEHHHTSLVVRRGARSNGGALLIVSRGPEGGALRIDERGRPDFGEIVIPRMEPLASAEFVDGGGSGGGGDHVVHHERLITPTAPSGIVAHYMSQLVVHGWTAGECWVSASGCVQWVSAVDARGRAWTGMLSARSIGSCMEVCVHMDLVQTVVNNI